MHVRRTGMLGPIQKLLLRALNLLILVILYDPERGGWVWLWGYQSSSFRRFSHPLARVFTRSHTVVLQVRLVFLWRKSRTKVDNCERIAGGRFDFLSWRSRFFFLKQSCDADQISFWISSICVDKYVNHVELAIGEEVLSQTWYSYNKTMRNINNPWLCLLDKIP